jgi:hypothetical protein
MAFWWDEWLVWRSPLFPFRRPSPSGHTHSATATSRSHRLQQVILSLPCGDDWHGTDTEEKLVFTTSSGRPIESHSLARSFFRICKQHGLRRITVHGLRHSNATTQKDLQVHARDIQAVLGHGDVRTTGIYEHVDLDSKRNALQKVEGRLFAEHDSARCNPGALPSELPAELHFIVTNTSNNFGGASQTRTGDTRLFRPIEATLQERLTSVTAQYEHGRARGSLDALPSKLPSMTVRPAVTDIERWRLANDRHHPQPQRRRLRLQCKVGSVKTGPGGPAP